MKKGILFASAVVLLIGAVAGFLYCNLKNANANVNRDNNKEEALLSAEYAYALIFLKANITLNNINEKLYENQDQARFKTNFLLGQIDLKPMKKDVEKCLVDNGISYERTEDEELLEKCEQPFFEQVLGVSKDFSLSEEKMAEALFSHHLAQLPLKTNLDLEEKGYSEAAVTMAPLIAYTRIDVHECVEKAVSCFKQDKADGKDVTLDYCLQPCNAEYARALESVLKDYEYSVVR